VVGSPAAASTPTVIVTVAPSRRFAPPWGDWESVVPSSSGWSVSRVRALTRKPASRNSASASSCGSPVTSGTSATLPSETKIVTDEPSSTRCSATGLCSITVSTGSLDERSRTIGLSPSARSAATALS
jgi:hypothetical protein